MGSVRAGALSLDLLPRQVLGALNTSVEISWWRDSQGAPSVVPRSEEEVDSVGFLFK